MIKKFTRKIKNIIPRSLLGRSILIIIIPAILVQIISVHVFMDNHWRRMTDRMAGAVAGEIAVVAKQYESGNKNAEELAHYMSDSLDIEFSFEKGKKEISKQNDIDSFWQSMVRDNLRKEIIGRIGQKVSININSDERWVDVQVLLNSGVLNVRVAERRLFSSSSYIFLLWMLLSTIILFFIAIIFMRNQIRPIRKLAIAAERFGKGRDVPYFKVEGAREVRQAAEAFIKMQERIKKQISQRTTMLAGVSHDLRTPITRMKLELAMFPPDFNVDDMKSDLAEMERMIDAYLDFAKSDAGEQIAMTNLSLMIADIATTIERHGVDIKTDIEEGVNVSVRPVAMERCLMNIVTNAEKYADKIWVSLKKEENYILISVDDDGVGIAKDVREDVFKPFFRIEGSRNIKTGGAGLGLSIALDVVNLHGGKIWLDDSEHGGLKVSIKIPL